MIAAPSPSRGGREAWTLFEQCSQFLLLLQKRTLQLSSTNQQERKTQASTSCQQQSCLRHAEQIPQLLTSTMRRTFQSNHTQKNVDDRWETCPTMGKTDCGGLKRNANYIHIALFSKGPCLQIVPLELVFYESTPRMSALNIEGTTFHQLSLKFWVW